MGEKFGWAFIGAGKLGATVAKLITASGRHRIVSVYVRNPEKRAAFAKRYGALAAATAEEAISAEGVDGVYIVTPHTSHMDYAIQAIELGKPVLCEKPVTTDAAKARAIIELARERGVYFAEAMWTWFSPVAHKVKEWVDAGEYGQVKSLDMTYCMRSIGYAPRVSDPMLAGGALLDIGIYPLTYAYRLFGKPEHIICSGTLKDGVDISEEIKLIYLRGPACRIRASIVDVRGLESMRLVGTEGRTDLLFYHAAGGVKLKREGEPNLSFKGDGGYLNEFDLVAGEISEGLKESRLVPHQATLDVMEIMDECRAQMGLVYPFEK